MNSTSDYDQQINPIRSQLPDRNKIEAHIQYQIKMDGLPDNAKKAYKFKNMQEPLVLIPMLCENECEVTSTKQHVQVSRGGRSILTGNRETVTNMWRFPNTSKPQPYMQK